MRGSYESEQNEGGAPFFLRKSLPYEGLARKWDGDAKTIDKAGFRDALLPLPRKRVEVERIGVAKI